ncbi:MAG: PBP1b-binding outer membrane lipoprotein LpoB [Spirosomataceae bacterium]|jgi:PBP1b-binding outer membrane lipoprotein LpoB
MKRLIVLIFITLVLYSCGNEATKNVDKNNAQLAGCPTFVCIYRRNV